MKIGIIGAGAAGLTAAWLLEKEHEVVLFEKNNYLGGHAHTIYADIAGKKVPVEAGFEFFNEWMFPRFTRLLSLLSVPTATYPMTFTFYNQKQSLVFPPFRPNGFAWKMILPGNVGETFQFGYVARKARDLINEGNTRTTIQQFIDTLRVTTSFKDHILLPFLTAGWGCSLEDFRSFPAYIVARWMAINTDHASPVHWSEITEGTSSYIAKLVHQLHTTKIIFPTSIFSISYHDNVYVITDNNNIATEVDHLIMATGALDAAHLLKDIAHAQKAASLLHTIGYFPTTIAIHGDESLMPIHKNDWSVANIRFDNGNGSSTTYKSWKSETPIFRSWVTYDMPPYMMPGRVINPVYALVNFMHQKLNATYFDVQKYITSFQGEKNLWFAGLYTHDIDSHESAIVSAIKAAQYLAPSSERLKELMK